jgi:predicted dehydrogenase
MKKALVIGLGMGQQYRDWLCEMGYDVDTVDPDPKKGASFLTDAQAAGRYEVAIICTPNWTHYGIATRVAKRCDIVMVEKPGVRTSVGWQQLVDQCRPARVMMIKNNQWRDTMPTLKDLAGRSHTVEINWTNANRIPWPGSWFTTKELAFGGVSRDLMPHMLSYYTAIAPYDDGLRSLATAEQRHQLGGIESTDYGEVKHDGVYDVDDRCVLHYEQGRQLWVLTADWKNEQPDDSSIVFHIGRNTVRHSLGLCPKEAYQAMIAEAVANIEPHHYSHRTSFWADQLRQDLWIHQQIEGF